MGAQLYNAILKECGRSRGNAAGIARFFAARRQLAERTKEICCNCMELTNFFDYFKMKQNSRKKGLQILGEGTMIGAKKERNLGIQQNGFQNETETR